MICFIMLFLCHFCIMIVSALFCAQSLRFVFYYYLLGKVVAEVEEEEASEVRAHLRLCIKRTVSGGGGGGGGRSGTDQYTPQISI